MKRISTLFHLDRIMNADTLATGVAQVAGVPREAVATADFSDVDRVPVAWFTDDHDLGIQFDTMRGDFPQEVTVVSHAPRDFEALVRLLAPALGVTVLTDEFGVNPYSDAEWTMITPDGTATPVLADEDEFGAEDPAITLLPEYRRMYDARNVVAGIVL